MEKAAQCSVLTVFLFGNFISFLNFYFPPKNRRSPLGKKKMFVQKIDMPNYLTFFFGKYLAPNSDMKLCDWFNHSQQFKRYFFDQFNEKTIHKSYEIHNFCLKNEHHKWKKKQQKIKCTKKGSARYTEPRGWINWWHTQKLTNNHTKKNTTLLLIAKSTIPKSFWTICVFYK